jgi:hypothetical protein
MAGQSDPRDRKPLHFIVGDRLLETERERETVAVLDASRSKMRGDGGGVEHNCISTVYQSV